MSSPSAPRPIIKVESDEQIRACREVMLELRPHLADVDFLPRIRQQQAGGYHLAMLVGEGMVRTVAGYRLGRFLAWGNVLYVDDLVTRAADRGRGYGEAMLQWLTTEARAAGCDELHLDSGHQRHEAHRFYLNQGMRITSHHFSMKL